MADSGRDVLHIGPFWAMIGHMAAPLSTSPLRPAGHACDAQCVAASGDPASCTCECQGRNHGASRNAVHISTPASQAKAWARIPQDDSDEWWVA